MKNPEKFESCKFFMAHSCNLKTTEWNPCDLYLADDDYSYSYFKPKKTLGMVKSFLITRKCCMDLND